MLNNNMSETHTQSLSMTAFSESESKLLWNDIERHIEHALDFSPDVTLEDVRRAVFKGTYHVIGVYRNNAMVGAVIYKLQSIHGKTVAFVMAIGGRWIATPTGIETFKEFLRAFGVSKLQGIARPSVARLWQKLGVTPIYTVMETNL